VKLALIHNPNAFRGEAEGKELRRVFERSGHSLEYVTTEEPNWQHVISQEISRAIIVGGDGTVQLVAPHLKGTPFSILPFGTANNIAQCLHQTPDPELLASQLDQAKICHLDLGKVRHGGASKTFLEAAGMGVFVELILAMQDWPKKLEMEQAESRKEKFAHALEELQAISRQYEGIAWELKVDDTVITDRFLLIAVTNMELIGPRLHLAPNADPGDGFLDLVLVREGDRANLCRWLECQSPGQKRAANLESRRCRRVVARPSDVAPVHIDSQLVQRPEFPVIVELEPAALRYTVLRG
jgi:diacylglycerol kinase (ATP)